MYLWARPAGTCMHWMRLAARRYGARVSAPRSLPMPKPGAALLRWLPGTAFSSCRMAPRLPPSLCRARHEEPYLRLERLCDHAGISRTDAGTRPCVLQSRHSGGRGHVEPAALSSYGGLFGSAGIGARLADLRGGGVPTLHGPHASI